jgi:hypothetical protein
VPRPALTLAYGLGSGGELGSVATVGSGASVGSGGTVDSGATVGSGASVGSGANVGSGVASGRALGSGAIVGSGVVSGGALGSGAIVGSGAGPDPTDGLGRGGTISSRVGLVATGRTSRSSGASGAGKEKTWRTPPFTESDAADPAATAVTPASAATSRAGASRRLTWHPGLSGPRHRRPRFRVPASIGTERSAAGDRPTAASQREP